MNAPGKSLYEQVVAEGSPASWGYYNSSLLEYSHTLLPRPMETFVDWCVSRISRYPDRPMTVVDLLAGPGCLANIRDIVMSETGGR